MPRHLLIPLLLALAGCSGGTVGSGPGPDTRSQAATSRGAAPARGPTTGAAPNHAPPPPATAPAAGRTPRGPEQLQALIADLRDPDDARRLRAAKELRSWGKEAEPAARPLATAIATSAGAEPRQAALEALEAIYPDLAPDLRALVVGDDPPKRIAAAKHLLGLSPEAGKPFLPIIAWRIAGLPAEASQPNVGYAVAGEEYAALVALLPKAGLDAEGFQAVVACANVSPEAGKPLWEPAQLTLCEIAKQDEGRRKEALAALDASLSSRTSVATIRAVGDLGTGAKDLALLLRTLAADRDENVRKAAAEALKKVQG